MHLYLAILLGKLIAYLSRLVKIGGGSAAPGLYALKIYPGLLEELIHKIPTNVVITGTNGKTTTARMLAHFAKMSGLKVIRNHTGSNLERGIASTLISHFSFPTSYSQLGIWELDEAVFNNVTPKIKPDMVVFLNVFRDQLDRYGEVDSVVKRWCETLKALTSQTIVLVNGDDVNTSKLAQCFKGRVVTFGVKDYKLVGESLEKNTPPSMSSLRKQGSIKKWTLDFEAKNVKLNGLDGSKFEVFLHNKSYTTDLPLPGVYHIYDFLAAFAVGHELGFSTTDMLSALKGFQPAFGRVEKLPFGYIFLIKNPAGATQVFETIATQIKSEDRLLLALNDNLADGTDVSWIWDAQFEQLITPPSLREADEIGPMQSIRNKQIAASSPSARPRNDVVVSGTRAYDLANRLKYAGFDTNSIKVEPDLKKALKRSREGLKGTLYILPTYTAMLELQNMLAKSGVKKHYWEEE